MTKKLTVFLSVIALAVGAAGLSHSSAEASAYHGYDLINDVKCHLHVDSGETHCVSFEDCLETCYTGECC